MSADLQLLIDSIGTDQQDPDSEPPRRGFELPRSIVQYAGWAIVGLLLAYVAYGFLNKHESNDEALVSTPHLLIVEERADREKLDHSQIAIFNSVPLREFYAENDIEYRCYDAEDKLTDEPETFQELRDLVTEDLPAVIFANKSKTYQFKLPESPEAMEQQIKKLSGGRR